jgi:hypothetical protein
MEIPRIILPNDVDIEFKVLETSQGILVTCTLCELTCVCLHPSERFRFIAEHRAEHFGEKLEA